jgi:hypothetical protein
MTDLRFPTNCRQHLKDLKCFDFAERDKFMKRSLLDRIQFRFYTWHFSNRVMVTYNFLSEVIFVLVLVLYDRAANSARNARFLMHRLQRPILITLRIFAAKCRAQAGAICSPALRFYCRLFLPMDILRFLYLLSFSPRHSL